jgi:type II secretory pathway component PulF
VAAGIEGGNLADVLRHAAADAEFSGKFRREMFRASLYPGFIILACLLFMTLINAVVSGNVGEALFEPFGEILDPKTGKPVQPPVPGSSALLLWLGENVLPVWIVFGLLGGVYATLVFLSPHVRSVERMAWAVGARMPWIAHPLKAGLFARFLRILHGLVKAGVPLPRALGYVESSMSGTPAEGAAGEIRRGCEEGISLSDAMAGSPIFPTGMVWGLKGGETAGNLPEVLASLAEIQRDRWERGMAYVKAVVLPGFQVGAGLVLLWVIFYMLGSYLKLLSSFSMMLA